MMAGCVFVHVLKRTPLCAHAAACSHTGGYTPAPLYSLFLVLLLGFFSAFLGAGLIIIVTSLPPKILRAVLLFNAPV